MWEGQHFHLVKFCWQALPPHTLSPTTMPKVKKNLSNMELLVGAVDEDPVALELFQESHLAESREHLSVWLDKLFTAATGKTAGPGDIYSDFLNFFLCVLQTCGRAGGLFATGI